VALTAHHTPNSTTCNATASINVEVSVDWYVTLWIHVSIDRKPWFIAKENRCVVYFSIRGLMTTCWKISTEVKSLGLKLAHCITSSTRRGSREAVTKEKGLTNQGPYIYKIQFLSHTKSDACPAWRHTYQARTHTHTHARARAHSAGNTFSWR
jgi:hypothetical protein